MRSHEAGRSHRPAPLTTTACGVDARQDCARNVVWTLWGSGWLKHKQHGHGVLSAKFAKERKALLNPHVFRKSVYPVPGCIPFQSRVDGSLRHFLDVSMSKGCRGPIWPDGFGKRFPVLPLFQGDSGGPLQVLEKPLGLYSIVGITSFGQLCGGMGVYVRVSAYLDWIEDVVWPTAPTAPTAS